MTFASSSIHSSAGSVMYASSGRSAGASTSSTTTRVEALALNLIRMVASVLDPVRTRFRLPGLIRMIVQQSNCFQVVERGEKVRVLKRRTDWFLVQDADGREGAGGLVVAEAGAERIYLQVLDMDDLDHLRLVADQVMKLLP